MIAYEVYKETTNWHIHGGKIRTRYSLALLMEDINPNYITYWNQERMTDWLKKVGRV
jgi:hypothetical protein